MWKSSFRMPALIEYDYRYNTFRIVNVIHTYTHTHILMNIVNCKCDNSSRLEYLINVCDMYWDIFLDRLIDIYIKGQ